MYLGRPQRSNLSGRSQTACRRPRRIKYKILHIWDLPGESLFDPLSRICRTEENRLEPGIIISQDSLRSKI